METTRESGIFFFVVLLEPHALIAGGYIDCTVYESGEVCVQIRELRHRDGGRKAQKLIPVMVVLLF